MNLRPGVVLYLPDHIDRENVGRLVKAMCSLNGIPVAIELLTERQDVGEFLADDAPQSGSSPEVSP